MDYTIQDLPEEERPREKLEQVGASSMTDTELLAIVLRTGTQGKNVKELSGEILNTYSLADIGNRSLQELQEFDGISRVKAGQLKAVGELATRLQTEERDTITSLEDVAARVRDMRFLDTEQLRIFYLSNGNELLQEEEVPGSLDSVDITPRTIFRSALQHNAAAVILAHNHPSGTAAPTEQDRAVTRRLIDIGNTLDVTVLDHIIVGDDITSIRDQEPSMF